MKKILLFGLAIAGLSLASCSDSDDAPALNPAEEVAGTYLGYTVASSAYFDDMIATDQSVTIAATATSGHASVAFSSDTWGDITIADAAVVPDNRDGYAISGTGVSLMGMQGQEPKEYTCNLSGTIDAQGSATLSFACPQIMGGLTIAFHSGNAPQQAE